jgi:hypothetical protein
LSGHFTLRSISAEAIQLFRSGHYSVAQIDELVAALELIADEQGRSNKTLQMLQLEATKRVVA